MKITLVANGYPPTAYGGVEVYVYQLANYLVSCGHQVTVFCRESSLESPDYLVKEDSFEGVRIIRIVNDFKKTSSFSDTFQDRQIENVFTTLLRKETPDIVHFNHLIALSSRLPSLADQMRIPFIVSLHDYWPICFQVRLIDWRKRQCAGPMKGGDCYRCIQGGDGNLGMRILRTAKDALPFSWRQFVRKKILRRSSSTYLTNLSREAIDQRYRSFKDSILAARRILTPSQFVRGQYVQNGYPEERIEVLKLGVEFPSAPKKPSRISGEIASERIVRFVFIGSLIPDKGVDVMIRAFRKLDKDRIRLRIYGRDDIAPIEYRNVLKKISAGDERIEFLGSFKQEARASVYSDVDAVIVPSRAPETFSIVAHEALAFGVPVIASDIGALPEVVIHGVNGFLISPGDPTALYEVLDNLSSNPGLLTNLQVPGPVTIYSMKEHGEMIEKIYQEAAV